LSLTASSWPLVDDRGRLRFPVTDDPVELHVERDELQAFVDAHRARWRRLDVIGTEQVTRPIRLGDTFAVRLERSNGQVVQLDGALRRRSGPPVEYHLELPRRTFD